MSIQQYFSVRPLALMEIDSRDARLILAARSWCILRGARQDPLARLESCLGTAKLALRFALLMDVVQQIWPEPFAIHRPCCPTASIDEALLSHAINYANLDARPAFDALLCDMLGIEARELLFTRARSLYQI